MNLSLSIKRKKTLSNKNTLKSLYLIVTVLKIQMILPENSKQNSYSKVGDDSVNQSKSRKYC